MRPGHRPKERPFCRYPPAIPFNLVLHGKVLKAMVVRDLLHELAEVSFSTPPSARRSSTLVSPQQVSLFFYRVFLVSLASFWRQFDFCFCAIRPTCLVTVLPSLISYTVTVQSSNSKHNLQYARSCIPGFQRCDFRLNAPVQET